MLEGRTALVTGASRGIGLSISQALSRAGARVAMVARDPQKLAMAAKKVGENSLALPCDISDGQQVARVIEEITQTCGDIDIVVNNAGLFLLGGVNLMEVDVFSRVVNVNLVAPFGIVRAVLPRMIERRRGHIVTIGSEADHKVFPENGAYAASKFGARALHEVMLVELLNTGVRATLISPGPTDTPLWDEIDPDNKPGFLPRAAMLKPAAAAAAVLYAVTQPEDVNIDEVRLSSN